MANQIWKASVQKAFYGFVGYTLLSGVVGGIISLTSAAAGAASLLSGGGGGAMLGPIVVGILALVAYVYYFLGIKGMKEGAVGSIFEEGAAQLYKGALLGLIGAIVSIIPLIGFVGSIVSLIGFIFMLLAFGKLKKLQASEYITKGAKQLWISMIVQLVAVVIGLIPFVGGIIAMICSIVVLVLSFLGWRNLSKSEI